MLQSEGRIRTILSSLFLRRPTEPDTELTLPTIVPPAPLRATAGEA
jgi:hypothetical protein